MSVEHHMAIEDRVEKCRFMIKGIVNSYFVSDQNLKLLQPLLTDENLYSTWDFGEGVDGVAAMRMALYSHVLSDMRAIMFDPGKNVTSMKKIIAALECNVASKIIKESFCTPTGVNVCGDYSSEDEQSIIESIQKEEVEQKESLFDKTKEPVLPQFYELENSDLGRRIDAARSKIISHKQVTTIEGKRKLFDASDFGLKFSDAKDIVEESKAIIFDTNLLLLNGSYDLKEFLGHHDLVATKFWSKCQNA
jgi:hypothetical protein